MKGKSRPDRKTGKFIKCKVCNKQFYCKHCHIGKKKYCSPKCRVKSMRGYIPWNKGKKYPQFSRENSSKWKGGKRFNRGYIQIYKPEHPFSCYGYVLEHRLVIEKQIGRYLNPFEHCHHLNKNKDDNRPENLMTFISNSTHRRFENNKPVKPSEIIFDGRTVSFGGK